MPPRTRTRATKDLKENVDIVKKTKVKSNGKVSKPPRKAFADKTNSLSDDNASIDVPILTSKVVLKNKAQKAVSNGENRPRRDRRLPTRYIENPTLKNLSSNKTPVENQSLDISAKSSTKALSKIRQVKQPDKTEVEFTGRPKRNCRLESAKEPAEKKPGTSNKQISQTIRTSSPFKTPSQSLDSSLIANRPKRICRLPSRFEDHSISPNKFIPVQPCHASTPITQKKAVAQARKSNDIVTKDQQKQTIRKDNVNNDVKTSKGIEHYFSKSQIIKKTNVKDTLTSSKDKTSPDTNNNPKSKRIQSKKVISTKSPTKQTSPKTKPGFGKRLLEQSLSFRVFEDRKSDKGEDVYEFTYDPKEEPPLKKKRKRVVKKRPTPKSVVFKNNYEKNLQNVLESLKSKVQPKSQAKDLVQSQKPEISDKNPGKIQIIEDIIIKPAVDNKSLNHTPAQPTNESAKSIHMSNYASIHVEDIAADFEMDNNDNINYSPVNSPFRPKTPEIHDKIDTNAAHEKDIHDGKYLPAVNNKDPLNLQEDSFFEEQPVASSSMNVSVRHPLASPWRVEFGNLPIRWQADTYVKPNMTPAVESSFINSEEISMKKHVYTNMVPEEPLPQIEDPPQLKQTSIISFMREVAERSLKKKRNRSMSLTKANLLFEDMGNAYDFGFKTPKKAKKDKVVVTPNKSNEKEFSNHENENNANDISNENSIEKSEQKSTQKSNKNKDGTFFGFDESEDQENVSPIKIQNTRTRGLRSKSRAILQEINAMRGPTRAVIPVKSKLPNTEVVEKLYDQLKSAEAPQAQEEEKAIETAANNVSDEESVHLFEDIDLIHHLKPHRKSYGKAKKVTSRQHSSDSNTQTQAPEVGWSDDDDMADQSFQVPYIKEKVAKKKKKKKQMSKKEEKEVEEWAAGFNSMCKDIGDFALVVE